MGFPRERGLPNAMNPRDLQTTSSKSIPGGTGQATDPSRSSTVGMGGEQRGWPSLGSRKGPGNHHPATLPPPAPRQGPSASRPHSGPDLPQPGRNGPFSPPPKPDPINFSIVTTHFLFLGLSQPSPRPTPLAHSWRLTQQFRSLLSGPRLLGHHGPDGGLRPFAPARAGVARLRTFPGRGRRHTPAVAANPRAGGLNVPATQAESSGLAR